MAGVIGSGEWGVEHRIKPPDHCQGAYPKGEKWDMGYQIGG
jgi:hypothetical protein